MKFFAVRRHAGAGDDWRGLGPDENSPARRKRQRAPVTSSYRGEEKCTVTVTRKKRGVSRDFPKPEFARTLRSLLESS